MALSYSIQTQSVSGNTTFSFTLSGPNGGYLRESDIHVYVYDVGSPSEDGEVFGFTFNSVNELDLSVAPDVGQQVLVRRIMPKGTTYSTFKRGSAFTQELQYNTALQSLYAAHEALDGFRDEGTFAREDIDMQGYMVTNLGTPVDPTDAATVEFVGTFKDDAEAAQAAAEVAQLAAEVAQTASEASATASQNSSIASAASAAAALVSETNAGLSETEAQASEDAALASEIAALASQIAAAASAAAALVSEGLADADATQTALDRIATNADALQTALDRVATAADVVTTNADVVLAQDARDDAQAYAASVGKNTKYYVKYLADVNTGRTGTVVIDGGTPADLDRVVCNAETDPVNNGIYIYNSAGAWIRSVDMDEPDECNMANFFVQKGTLYAGTWWVQLGEVATIGTDEILFTIRQGAGASVKVPVYDVGHNFIVGEAVRKPATGWVKSYADDGDTSEVEGIVASVLGDDNFEIAPLGSLDLTVPEWTAVLGVAPADGDIWWLNLSTETYQYTKDPLSLLGDSNALKVALKFISATEAVIKEYPAVILGDNYSGPINITAADLTAGSGVVTITHNLNTKNPVFSVFEGGDGDQLHPEVTARTLTSIELDFTGLSYATLTTPLTGKILGAGANVEINVSSSVPESVGTANSNGTPSLGAAPIDHVHSLDTGMVVKVVSAKTSNTQATTSSSWATKTDPAPSITTTVLNSKILVQVSMYAEASADSIVLDLRREVSGGSNTDNISGESEGIARINVGGGIQCFYIYEDSPSQAAGTTITYKINFRNTNSSTSVSIGRNDEAGQITLMEIMP